MLCSFCCCDNKVFTTGKHIKFKTEMPQTYINLILDTMIDVSGDQGSSEECVHRGP